MFCPRCGKTNDDNSYACVHCQNVLHASVQPSGAPAAAVDNSLGGLIPVKNSPALISYYCGVFSVIPCVGLPLGLAALALGLKGLSRLKEQPEAGGRFHAWVGILVGGFCGLANLAVLALMALGMLAK